MKCLSFITSVGLGIAFGFSAAAVSAEPEITMIDRGNPPGYSPTIASKVSLGAYVKSTVDKSLADAAAGDVNAACAQLAILFDQTIASSADTDLQPMVQAAFALRLARYVQKVPANEQRDWFTYFKANPDLAGTLMFLMKPETKPQRVFALLKRLRDARGASLEKYANLTAAICVDHAQPLKRGINENPVTAPDPLEIFDFYVKNEARMFFGIRAVPAELLVWVVDTTASIDEMNWALAKYAGDREVGARFFDVQYDYDNFEKGTPKKVNAAGYNLPNILRYGGICADQAYFAMEVAKSIGVPSAYDVGESADAAHAWVGFLQAQGHTGAWNFNTGRYPEYRGVRGEVMDPQTRKYIPDSYVSLLAEMIGTRPQDRQTGAALVDAANRLASLEKAGKELDAHAFPQGTSISNLRTVPRKATTADALALTELALKQSAGYPPAWFVIRDLARADKLSSQDKQRWAGVVQRLGGVKYPEFTLSILIPMIQTIPDPKDQNALWNSAFTMYQSRFDLAALIRMQQAAVWKAQGNTVNAGTCYMDVIERYADAGPFVLDALKEAEKLLKESGQSSKIVALYQHCWAKTVPPPADYSQILSESIWYRVGKLYAGKLKAAGDATGSQAVLDKLRTPSRTKS